MTMKLKAFILLMLLASAVLVLAGTTQDNHLMYYYAIPTLASSALILMYTLSFTVGSWKAVGLCIANTLLIAVFIAIRSTMGFPIIASFDWTMGCFIIVMFLADMMLYTIFLRRGFHDRRIASGITVLGFAPLVSMVLFYAGVDAWIGLSTCIIASFATLLIINKYINDYSLRRFLKDEGDLPENDVQMIFPAED